MKSSQYTPKDTADAVFHSSEQSLRGPARLRLRPTPGFLIRQSGVIKKPAFLTKYQATVSLTLLVGAYNLSTCFSKHLSSMTPLMKESNRFLKLYINNVSCLLGNANRHHTHSSRKSCMTSSKTLMVPESPQDKCLQIFILLCSVTHFQMHLTTEPLLLNNTNEHLS